MSVIFVTSASSPLYIETSVIMISMNFTGEFHTFAIDFTCCLVNPLTGVGAEEGSLKHGDDTPCLAGD